MILIKFKKESLAALEVRLWVGKSRSRKICLEVVRARVEVCGGRGARVEAVEGKKAKDLNIHYYTDIHLFPLFQHLLSTISYIWCQLKNNMG